ncbi:MAG: peptide chain release factor N(5)-glutamine methyltransferase [Burkholderiales bacterium]
MSTLQAEIRAAAGALAASLGLPPRETRLEAQILLGHALGKPRAWLLGHDTDTLSGKPLETFQTLLARRQKGEPIAYITGEREFFSLNFKVSPAVLIPRPETELLVELALEKIPADSDFRVLDLGTGSGAIAVSLAKQRPLARITAADRSAAALAVAAENARLHMTPQVRWVQSDWFSALEGEKFDLIVSNPPYIACGDAHLRQGDLVYEPASALVSGSDGLDDIRRILAQAPLHLSSDGGAGGLEPGAWLLFEHGYDQAPACRALLSAAGFTGVFSANDLAGIPRVSGGLWRKNER